MDSRKGLLPVALTRSAGVELTRSSASANTSVTPSTVPTTPLSKGHSSVDSNVNRILEGLRRLTPSLVKHESAPERLDFSFQFPSTAPVCSLPSRVTRMTPRMRASSPSSSSSSSHASSCSRNELRADMACVVPPANTPHVSYKVAAGKSWPRGNTMHSRNSSMSSTTSANASTPSNLSIVPELSPSKSESHFDTTSTRAAVNFAAAEISANENNENTTSDKSKERSLYGPLEIDASCFSFSSSNYSQTLDVAWTTTSKDNPLLFNNVLAKANAVFSGDYNAMFEHAVHEPSATELRAHERKRRQLQLRREQQEREWEELVGCALHFAVDLRAAKELWRCNDRVAAKELLQQQVAVAFAEWRSQQNAGRLDFVKTPPGLPSKGGGVAAAAERAVVAFPPPSVKQSQDVFHNSGSARPAVPEEEEEDKNDAWETCENSPVSTSSVDASSMDKSGGGVEDSTTQASQEEPLCSSAVKAGNNANIDMPMLSSKPIALSLRSGHSSNRGLEHGEAEENDASGNCAIESCSFISRPHLRRYY